MVQNYILTLELNSVSQYYFSSRRTVVGGREKVNTKRETSYPDWDASNDSAILWGMSWNKELLHHFVTLSGTHTQKSMTISLGLWTENNSQWVVLIMLENKWKIPEKAVLLLWNSTQTLKKVHLAICLLSFWAWHVVENHLYLGPVLSILYLLLHGVDARGRARWTSRTRIMVIY